MHERKRNHWDLWIVTLAICLFLSLWSQPSIVAAAERESALTRIQRTGVIRAGWATWFPWSFVDSKTNKLVGIGPEVMEELANALGNVKIEWIADNWATLVAGLQADKFDVTYPLGVTLPRAMACDFTDDTTREGITFLIKKKDTTKFKSFDDVDQPGVKIAVTLGSNGDLYAAKFFKKPEIVRLKSSPEGVMAVVLGKADAYSAPASQIVDAMKTHKEIAPIKGSFALGKNAMAIRQGDQSFLNWLNLFIADMKETRTLDRILQKYGTKREVFFD
jgi:ABC-type amino acid transport substrate-binding protein